MKMKNSLLKKTTAGLFTAATVLTMAAASMTVLAEDKTFTNEDSNGDLNVTFGKTLILSKGVSLTTENLKDKTGNLEFNFTFTPNTALSTVETVDEMPKIGDSDSENVKVDENGVTTITLGRDSEFLYNSNGDEDEDTVSLTDVSDDLIIDGNFQRAGEYVYTVVETEETTFTEHNSDNEEDYYVDKMTMDKTKYNMHVLVKNKADGSGCYVSAVYFVETRDSLDGLTEEEKKNYNLASDNSYEKKEKADAAELFKNVYTKEAGKNPDANNSKSSLGITKTVVGEHGDKKKAFDFTITLYGPDQNLLDAIIKEKEEASDESLWSSLIVENGEVTKIVAYVQEISETDKSGISNKKITLAKEGDHWTGEFKLTDGQQLTFASLPAGFKYTMTEAGAKNYTASAKVFENIDLRHKEAFISPITNSSLNPVQQRLYTSTLDGGISENSTPVFIASDSVNKKPKDESGEMDNGLNKTTKYLIGEHDNSFDVTNTFNDDSITPTGLIVKNLPFLVMIALGVLAFLGLTKKRRAND